MPIGGGVNVRPAVASLQASVPSTKNPVTNARPAAGTFSTTNGSTNFAIASTTDMAVVFQGAIDMTVSAQSVMPASAATQTSVEDRSRPSDTVGSGQPGL